MNNQHGAFEFAQLLYGTARYRVSPNDHPLPVKFDFNNPEECARKVFAIMSNAAGGHTLRDCKVRYHKERGTANLTANGAHIFFQTPGLPKLNVEQVCDMVLECVIISLGDVRTDQYGDGWKRAQWRNERVLVA